MWASSNGGVQWIQLTAAAAWTARANVNMVVTSDGVMVIAAGSDFNSLTKADAWLSVDGSVWLQLKPVSAQMMFSPRDWAAMALDSGNFLWLMGGTLRLQGDPNNPPAGGDAYKSSAAITLANVNGWYAAAGLTLPVVVGAGGVALASGTPCYGVHQWPNMNASCTLPTLTSLATSPTSPRVSPWSSGPASILSGPPPTSAPVVATSAPVTPTSAAPTPTSAASPPQSSSAAVPPFLTSSSSAAVSSSAAGLSSSAPSLVISSSSAAGGGVSPPVTTNNGGGGSGSSLSNGAVAGIVIGVAIGCLILWTILLVFCCGLAGGMMGKKGHEVERSAKFQTQQNEPSQVELSHTAAVTAPEETA